VNVLTQFSRVIYICVFWINSILEFYLGVIIKTGVVILLTTVLFCILLWPSRYICPEKIMLWGLRGKYVLWAFFCYMCKLFLAH
jgi:hypothetical protein